MTSVKRLYLNPKFSTSYTGLNTFYSPNHFTQKKDQVLKDLLKLPEYYLYRKSVNKFPRRKVLVFRPYKFLAMDLIDLTRYAKDNNGNKWILVVIDLFSKKLYAEPMKNKMGETTLKAFKKIFSKLKVKPSYVTSDAGNEFRYKELQKFLAKHDVIWYTTWQHSPIIEKVISSLMSRLIRVFNHYNKNNYVKHLQNVVNGYNNTRHSATGFKPNEVDEEHIPLIIRRLYKTLLAKSQEPPKKINFHLNQPVRISLVKDKFEKGYFPRWSLEEFKIAQIIPSVPTTYKVKDEDGEIVKGNSSSSSGYLFRNTQK